jgi:hypothetical protein
VPERSAQQIARQKLKIVVARIYSIITTIVSGNGDAAQVVVDRGYEIKFLLDQLRYHN